MTDNGTDPSPTPPARQQANRIRLAEDMRSGIYRQCEGGFYKLDDGPGGYSVCALGAAYEIARRWQLTDQKQPLKAISNWNAPVVPVVSDAYGFTFWQCVNLVLRNNHGRELRATGDVHSEDAARRVARTRNPVAQWADPAVAQRRRWTGCRSAPFRRPLVHAGAGVDACGRRPPPRRPGRAVARSGRAGRARADRIRRSLTSGFVSLCRCCCGAGRQRLHTPQQQRFIIRAQEFPTQEKSHDRQ